MASVIAERLKREFVIPLHLRAERARDARVPRSVDRDVSHAEDYELNLRIARQLSVSIHREDVIEHRQHSWHAETDWARLLIRIGLKHRRTGAKQFRFSQELSVHFQADNAFVFHLGISSPIAYDRVRWAR